jgi:hypothetical protein
VHVGEIGGHLVVGGELQPAGREVLVEQFRQSGLVERNVARRELGHLAGVDVDTDHLVAECRHPGRMGCAEVPGAEHSASHTAWICRCDELTATRH